MKLSDIGDCEINTIALATKSTRSISVPSTLRVMHFVEHSSATLLDGTFSVGFVEESHRSLGSPLLRMTIPEDYTWEQSPRDYGLSPGSQLSCLRWNMHVYGVPAWAPGP